MKKLLGIMLAGIFGIASVVGFADAASSDCLNFSFNNGDSMCLGITKNGNKNFEISIDKNNLSKNSEVRCYVIFENSSMRTLKGCEGTFNYAGSSTEDVIINATYQLRNKDFYSKRVSTEVNFNKGTWGTNHNLITSSKSSSSKSSSSSRRYSNDLDVSVSPSSPDTYEWIKLNIETDDDYVGKINFSKFQYRSSSSSSWSNISRTSSTYVSDYSNEWNNGYYRMTSSDDGDVTLKNFIKFKKSGYYRIYVEDTDGNESYVQINVDTSSSSSSRNYNDDIELSTNRKSPSTNQYVNLTIETDEDYVGRLSLSAKYRKSSSDSWSSISNTSSTYFRDYSDEWENGFYRMTSDDDGEVTLGDLVKFNKAGYYRIYVEDYDDNESYIEFSVDTAGSSNDNDELKVSVSPSNADTYEWIDLTVKTDADYDARIKISKLQYRSSSSDSWSNISNITSSTYVSDYSDAWSSSFRRIVTDEDGEATLRDIVKFKKAGYYRIYVEDTDDNESYVQVNVDTSSSSSSRSSSRYYGDEIELSTNRESPSTSQYVNLTIETDDSSYVGKLYLLAKYRSSSSKSWSNISNTSSTYFSDYSDEWEDGYYRMTSSDRGEITLKNLVKFRKDGYYRISVIDIDGNESYIEFSVGDVDDSSNSKSSSVNGFTNKELSKVKSVYNQWDNMISQMKKEYPSLKRDTYWIKLSDTFYNNMKDVVNNKKSRNFDDYDDYVKAFNSRYKYTTQNR